MSVFSHFEKMNCFHACLTLVVSFLSVCDLDFAAHFEFIGKPSFTEREAAAEHGACTSVCVSTVGRDGRVSDGVGRARPRRA